MKRTTRKPRATPVELDRDRLARVRGGLVSNSNAAPPRASTDNGPLESW